jgi:integrase
LRGRWRVERLGKAGTLAEYDRTYLRRIAPRFEGRPAADVDRAEVQRWVNGMLRDGLSRKTVYKALWQLRSIFDLAVSEGLDRNPTDDVTLPQPQRGHKPVETIRDQVLSHSEIERLADSIDFRFRSWVYIGAYLGMRPGEIAGLSIHSIDLEGRTLVVEQAVRDTHDERGERNGVELVPELKTDGAFRSIGFGPKVAAAIQRHLTEVGVADDGRLFYYSGNRIRGGGLVQVRGGAFREIWRAGFAAAGLKPIRPYDLRHTAATLAIDGGVPINRVAAMLGDSVETVARIYVHPVDLDQSDAATIEGTRHLVAVS